MAKLITLASLRKDVRKRADTRKADILQRFFKTGKGEYGEGDMFAGLMVPESRALAKKYSGLSFADVTNLLKSKVHEERFIALLMLIHRFQKGEAAEQKKIYNVYLKSTTYINNWDLIDLSAHKIVGAHIFKKSRVILYLLVRSKNLWERRIAVIATFYFIPHNDIDDCLKLAKLLLHDEQELIQKAVGWMLREVGNRDKATEVKFLNQHYKKMPRTMLRYAIERFSEKERQAYLKSKI